jgi:hypothetical protein
MALVLSHMRGTWEHSSPKSLSVYMIQRSCEQQLAATTYSASVVDWATLHCFFLNREPWGKAPRQNATILKERGNKYLQQAQPEVRQTEKDEKGQKAKKKPTKQR